MNNTIKIQDNACSVIEYVKVHNGNIEPAKPNESKAIPVNDIPLMNNYRWQELCLEDRLNNPEKYPDKEKLAREIERLTNWLEEHNDDSRLCRCR